jgi:hypothetical protein
LGLGLALLTCRLDRLIDQRVDGVRCVGIVPAQSQGRAKQGIRRWGRSLGCQLLTQSGGSTELAQNLKAQRLSAGTQGLRHTLKLRSQRLPLARGLYRSSGGLQQAPQRR